MRLAKKVLLFALIVSFSLVRLPAAVLAEEGEEPPYITVPASGGEDGGDGDSPQGNVDTDGQSAPSAGGQQATGDPAWQNSMTVLQDSGESYFNGTGESEDDPYLIETVL